MNLNNITLDSNNLMLKKVFQNNLSQNIDQLDYQNQYSSKFIFDQKIYEEFEKKSFANSINNDNISRDTYDSNLSIKKNVNLKNSENSDDKDIKSIPKNFNSKVFHMQNQFSSIGQLQNTKDIEVDFNEKTSKQMNMRNSQEDKKRSRSRNTSETDGSLLNTLPIREGSLRKQSNLKKKIKNLKETQPSIYNVNTILDESLQKNESEQTKEFFSNSNNSTSKRKKKKIVRAGRIKQSPLASSLKSKTSLPESLQESKKYIEMFYEGCLKILNELKLHKYKKPFDQLELDSALRSIKRLENFYSNKSEELDFMNDLDVNSILLY